MILKHVHKVRPCNNHLPRLMDLLVTACLLFGLSLSVHAQLGFFDYEARHTYSAVPSLAGRIKSEAGLSAVARNPNVIMIDIDVGGIGHLANSVPVIAADLRHAVGNTGTGIVVAVLDSGLDTDHDNLFDNLIAEACFADDDGTIDGAGRCPNGSDRQTGPGAIASTPAVWCRSPESPRLWPFSN